MTDLLTDEQLTEEMESWRRRIRAAQSTGQCVVCEQSAAERIYTPTGQYEYRISGTCEECFDRMFKERDDD